MSLLSARPAVILAIQGCYQFCCLVNRGKTVNSLPKSSTLTTRLPSHPDTQWLGIGDARRGYTHNYSTGGSTDLTLRRVLKLANHRAAPARGRSLLSLPCFCLPPTSVDTITQWREDWSSASVVDRTIVTDPTIRQPGFNLPHHTLSLKNRFRTGQGPCNANLHKWGLAQSPCCDCGQRQTTNHIVDTCPLTKFEGGLNPLHEEMMGFFGRSHMA